MPKIMSEYSPPEYRSDGFNCPYCSAYAKQTWWYIIPTEDKSCSRQIIKAISRGVVINHYPAFKHGFNPSRKSRPSWKRNNKIN